MEDLKTRCIWKKLFKMSNEEILKFMINLGATIGSEGLKLPKKKDAAGKLAKEAYIYLKDMRWGGEFFINSLRH